MDRRAWWAIVHGVTKRVGHDLATNQQQQDLNIYIELARKSLGFFSYTLQENLNELFGQPQILYMSYYTYYF